VKTDKSGLYKMCYADVVYTPIFLWKGLWCSVSQHTSNPGWWRWRYNNNNNNNNNTASVWKGSSAVLQFTLCNIVGAAGQISLVSPRGQL